MNVQSFESASVLSTIAAENAALKTKIKQGCYSARELINHIRDVDCEINNIKFGIQRCHEIYESKSRELSRIEEEISNICSSEINVQCNIDNLEKQYNLMLIDEEQQQKEYNSIQANYENMIRNQKEIYNSYPSVIKKNNLQNIYQASCINLSLLQQKEKEMMKQNVQMNQIQDLRLKIEVIELSILYCNLKKQFETQQSAQQKLKEIKLLEEQRRIKENDENQQESEVHVPQTEDSLTGSTLMNEDNFTLSTASCLQLTEQNNLIKCFEQMNTMIKHRSPVKLPTLLTKKFPLELKDKIILEFKASAENESNSCSKLEQKNVNNADKNNLKISRESGIDSESQPSFQDTSTFNESVQENLNGTQNKQFSSVGDQKHEDNQEAMVTMPENVMQRICNTDLKKTLNQSPKKLVYTSPASIKNTVKIFTNSSSSPKCDISLSTQKSRIPVLNRNVNLRVTQLPDPKKQQYDISQQNISNLRNVDKYYQQDAFSDVITDLFEPATNEEETSKVSNSNQCRSIRNQLKNKICIPVRPKKFHEHCGSADTKFSPSKFIPNDKIKDKNRLRRPKRTDINNSPKRNIKQPKIDPSIKGGIMRNISKTVHGEENSTSKQATIVGNNSHTKQMSNYDFGMKLPKSSADMFAVQNNTKMYEEFMRFMQMQNAIQINRENGDNSVENINNELNTVNSVPDNQIQTFNNDNESAKSDEIHSEQSNDGDCALRDEEQEKSQELQFHEKEEGYSKYFMLQNEIQQDETLMDHSSMQENQYQQQDLQLHQLNSNAYYYNEDVSLKSMSIRGSDFGESSPNAYSVNGSELNNNFTFVSPTGSGLMASCGTNNVHDVFRLMNKSNQLHSRQEVGIGGRRGFLSFSGDADDAASKKLF